MKSYPFEQLVAEKGLKDVTITKAGCIGTCYLEPIVDVYGDDGELEARYVKIQPDKVAEIVDKHLIGKTPVEELAISEEDKKFIQFVFAYQFRDTNTGLYGFKCADAMPEKRIRLAALEKQFATDSGLI